MLLNQRVGLIKILCGFWIQVVIILKAAFFVHFEQDIVLNIF